MKILCVFGRHQYGDPARGTSTEYASFVGAFRKLGHDVCHFDSWYRRRYSDYLELNVALFECARAYRPDIMFTVQLQYELWEETVQAISALGVTTVTWTTDDSWKFREVSRFIGRFYDVITTTYPECLADYHKAGIDNVVLTQWAAAAEMLRPPQRASQCKYGATFVGSAYGRRSQAIEYLKSRGIEITCFGHGWANGSVDYTDMVEIINNSRVSLNFSAGGKSPRRKQLKARTFEVPAGGGFLLTEKCPLLENYYVPGREVEAFESLTELEEKLRVYLRDDAARDAVARAGFERTVKEHTYEARLSRILDVAARMRSAPGRGCGNFELAQMSRNYRPTWPVKICGWMLRRMAELAFGRSYGPRVARRAVFEASWRLLGPQTFTSGSLPARMFPGL